jgi:hypothetical protein
VRTTLFVGEEEKEREGVEERLAVEEIVFVREREGLTLATLV